jgi:hypothetical protein
MAAENILGVIPENERESTLEITKRKFKSLLEDLKPRNQFLTDEFINSFCEDITWLTEPAVAHPNFYELFACINLYSYHDQRRYNRIIRFLNSLQNKRIHGFKYFRIVQHFPLLKIVIMRLNLIAFHFFDLRFEPRRVEPRRRQQH